MPSAKNINQLQQIKTKLTQAKSVVLSNYSGLTVNQQQQLRQQIIQAGGELMVAKNTLLNLALQAEKYHLPQDFASALQGPTITLFCYQDEIAPLKALYQFAQQHQLPEIKIGFLTKQPLTADQINQLAQLPSKPELIAKTIATINAPVSGFVNVLSGTLRNLVYALNAIKQSKS